jgi:uncharacterized lipoprotein YmbA
MRTRCPLPAVPAVLMALVLAACGASSPSASQLRVAATRACASAAAQAERIATPVAPAGSAEFLRRGLAVLTPELAQLRRLHAPSDLAATYSTALRSSAGLRALLGAAVQSLNRGADPVSTVQTLQRRLAPLEARGDAAWRALDLPACLNR